MGGHPWAAEQDRGRVFGGAHGQPVPLLAGELRRGLPARRKVCCLLRDLVRFVCCFRWCLVGEGFRCVILSWSLTAVLLFRVVYGFVQIFVSFLVVRGGR